MKYTIENKVFNPESPKFTGRFCSNILCAEILADIL
jgi:hypothetical protein